MKSKSDASESEQLAEAPERIFTVESANNALVFVRRVVEDAVKAYRELMRLRSEQHELALVVDTSGQSAGLRALMEEKVSRLKQLHQELLDVGGVIKDFAEGLVDFPARYEGRKVLLCWKLGEAEVTHWHELRAGFAGRQRIDAQFRLGVREPAPAETEAIRPC